MKEVIDITNTTLELEDIKDKWFYNEEYQAWCLEDILYTLKATTPKFQRLSIYVPKAYMNAPGSISCEAKINGYTAETAPIVFGNNSAGYMQMPHTYLGGPRDTSEKYLKAGMVYVTCGSRGSESRDQDGRLCGKSPMNLVDLKTGIRFIRHNRKAIPGDTDRIISVGWSAGGAMSALLAVTGNHEDYHLYLEENGAFMEESDQIFAAQIYCPIIDLEHGDMAYEWMFSADKECEDSPAGPSEVMTPFKERLSELLKESYIQYFNSLSVKNPETGEVMYLGGDGRSGSAYDYLMKKLNESAAKYLTKLQNKEIPETFTVEEYLSGNYTFLKEAAAPPDKKENAEEDRLGHFAEPGIELDSGKEAHMEPPTLGDIMARPPKGTPPMPVFKPPVVEVKGKDKRKWLKWDGVRAEIKDLDTYVLNHRGRMKPCTAFDTFENSSGENRLFGELNEEKHFMHFDTFAADAIRQLEAEFPEEAKKYYPEFAQSYNNPSQEKAKMLYNPLHYIRQGGEADSAQYYRIRVGASDADTSFSVSMTLACLLAEKGFSVDYELVWDKPHCDADYEGEVTDWINSIVKTC